MLERQLEVLGRLAEVGLQAALAAERLAQAEPDAAALEQIARAYARVSRAVRLTLTLQAKLAKDLQDAAETEAEEAEVREPAYRRKFRVERIVERLIKAEHDDEDAIDRLAGEAGERLDDEDLYGDLLAKPLGEVVALICKDLGLHPDWAKLAEEHWARAEIDSGAKGSPFNNPGAARAPPFSAENGGEGELCDRQGRSCERPPDGRAGLADPGRRTGEERVGVGETASTHPSTARPAASPRFSTGLPKGILTGVDEARPLHRFAVPLSR